MGTWFTGVRTQTRVLERQVTVAATFDPLHLPTLRPPPPFVSQSVSKLACAVFHHYSSSTFVSMRFHHCQEKFGACFRNVISVFFFGFYKITKVQNYLTWNCGRGGVSVFSCTHSLKVICFVLHTQRYWTARNLTFWILAVTLRTARFKVQKFTWYSHCVLVFCIDLQTNSDFCLMQL